MLMLRGMKWPAEDSQKNIDLLFSQYFVNSMALYVSFFSHFLYDCSPFTGEYCLFWYKRLNALSTIFMEYLSYGVYNPIEIDEVIKINVHSNIFAFASNAIILRQYYNRPSFIQQ